MKHQNAYQALLAESARVQLPIRFRTDLTRHDRTILAWPDAPLRFVWILGRDGTHLFGEDTSADCVDALRHCFGPQGSCRCESHRHYVWDGANLHSVDHAKAIDTIETWRRDEIAELPAWIFPGQCSEARP